MIVIFLLFLIEILFLLLPLLIILVFFILLSLLILLKLIFHYFPKFIRFTFIKNHKLILKLGECIFLKKVFIIFFIMTLQFLSFSLEIQSEGIYLYKLKQQVDRYLMFSIVNFDKFYRNQVRLCLSQHQKFKQTNSSKQKLFFLYFH